MSHYRLGFVMEQALGHVTHQQNLAVLVGEDPEVDASWFPVPYRADDRWSRLPLVGNNLSLSMSLRTRKRVLAGLARRPLDALLFHSQVTSLFSLDLMRRLPSIISLDATPIGKEADRPRSWGEAAGGLLRPVKMGWYRDMFGRASMLTTWNRWAAESLVRDYGVDPAKIAVIPPGVDLRRWRPVDRPPSAGRKARLLFVGADFARKGGPLLIEAFRGGLADRCELVIVTDADQLRGDLGDAIRVREDLRPNSDELRRLFLEADLFVLPTRQDCMPIAIIEAMASGLPVIATDIGAIGEQVEHGESGLLVPAGDGEALARAVATFLDDPAFLGSAAAAGRRRAERLFDGDSNYRALISLMKGCVDEGRGRVPAAGVGGPVV